MYCRTCGNKMNDNAEICVKCGVRRFVGYDYCQICGSKTSENMKTCPKCKAVLKSSMSTNQMKKTAISKGTKALKKGLLIFGWICIVGSIPIIFLERSLILTAIGVSLVVISKKMR